MVFLLESGRQPGNGSPANVLRNVRVSSRCAISVTAEPIVRTATSGTPTGMKIPNQEYSGRKFATPASGMVGRSGSSAGALFGSDCQRAKPRRWLEGIFGAGKAEIVVAGLKLVHHLRGIAIGGRRRLDADHVFVLFGQRLHAGGEISEADAALLGFQKRGQFGDGVHRCLLRIDGEYKVEPEHARDGHEILHRIVR